MLAGEPLPKQLVERIKGIIPKVTIYNGYGPSETTIFSAIADVTNQTTITIGKPINNTQIYILNKNKTLPNVTILALKYQNVHKKTLILHFCIQICYY